MTQCLVILWTIGDNAFQSLLAKNEKDRCIKMKRIESSKICYFSTVLTQLLPTMVSVSHIYCREIARFHCVCLSHRGCLISLSSI